MLFERSDIMPEKKTIQRARNAKRAGKSPSTQASEFVREEIRDIRKGKHGARSAKQAVAIGLSKARRAGVDLPPPEKGETSEKTRQSAKSAYRLGHGGAPKRKTTAKRRQASQQALEREGTAAASHDALSRQAKSAAKKRTAADRSAAAKKAARTKGQAGRSQAAKKAARTRAANA
jgi:hypothetical protein